MTLEMRILGVHETEGPWYVMEHRVLDSSGDVALDIGRSDWADWSRSGAVLFARDGCLFSLKAQAAGEISAPVLVADLRDLRFEEVLPPSEVRVWSGREPRGRPIAD